MASKMASCIFCKIIKGKSIHQAPMKLGAPSKTPIQLSIRLADLVPSMPGEIPCFKILETDKTLAFLDINPLSKGHAVHFSPTIATLSRSDAHLVPRIPSL